jgi:hypothetical protein
MLSSAKIATRSTDLTSTGSDCSSFVDDLDALAFVPFLTHFNALLPRAEELAKWADFGAVDDPTFGKTGEELLQEVFLEWMRIIVTKFLSGISSRLGVIVDSHRRLFVQSLDDLAKTVFIPRRMFSPDDGRGDSDEGIFDRHVLTQGASLGIPHSEFVKRIKYIIGLLNKIVPKQRVFIADADRRVRELTDSPKKKREFLALSETKQAVLIGCSWATYSKTRFYKDTQKKDLLPSSRPSVNRTGAKRSVPTVRLTTALAATTGEGGRDEVLCELLEGEEQVQKRRSWEDLPLSERQAIAIEQEEDMAADPSPLDTRPRRTRQR